MRKVFGGRVANAFALFVKSDPINKKITRINWNEHKQTFILICNIESHCIEIEIKQHIATHNNT